MINIIISGIGGQGTVSVGHILSRTLNELKLPFIASETHGMSQRGGSVVFHLKIGEKALSPLVEKGKGDIIIAGEPMEGVRVLDYLRSDNEGVVITGTHPILSPVAKQTGQEYPDIDQLYGYIRNWPAKLHIVDAEKMAKGIGSSKISNIIILGAVLGTQILPVSYDDVKEQIIKRWPKHQKFNLKALSSGFRLFHNHEKAEIIT